MMSHNSSIPPRICTLRVLEYCDAVHWACEPTRDGGVETLRERLRLIHGEFMAPDCRFKFALNDDPASMEEPLDMCVDTFRSLYLTGDPSIISMDLVPGHVEEYYTPEGNVICEAKVLSTIMQHTNGLEVTMDGALRVEFSQDLKMRVFHRSGAANQVSITQKGLEKVVQDYKVARHLGEYDDDARPPIEQLSQALRDAMNAVISDEAHMRRIQRAVKLNVVARKLNTLFSFMSSEATAGPKDALNQLAQRLNTSTQK